MKEIKIALIGGGPSALFILKKLIDANTHKLTVDIFESRESLGKGMPYSSQGALQDHVTNISSDELSVIFETLEEWIHLQQQEMLDTFNIDKATFNKKQVIPRLLFGIFLENQFNKLIVKANDIGLVINVHLNSTVVDILPSEDGVTNSILLKDKTIEGFNTLIICTGHRWPEKSGAYFHGYFDAPYPPHKLNKEFNHAIALKGSSLTAIDAIRTLSHANGTFIKNNRSLRFVKHQSVPNFKMVMFSLNGLLPNVRFHLDDPHVSSDGMLSDERIAVHKIQNGGFVSLDYLFEQNFKSVLKECDADIYRTIAHKNLEEFVDWMLESRKKFEPFTLLKIEYIQAEQSIKCEQTIQWKKLLALLSYTINQPAKYFSAEDTIRLHKVLQPLIAPIIANAPQSSVEQLIALHESGVLEIVPVDINSNIIIENHHQFSYVYDNIDHQQNTQTFKTFVDCTGQQPCSAEEFPFKRYLQENNIIPARVKFRDNKNALALMSQGNNDLYLGDDTNYYLTLQGFAINDFYQFVYADKRVSERCFIMAVPFISGFNPDYSGFDFCDQVSSIIVDKICHDNSLDLSA